MIKSKFNFKKAIEKSKPNCNTNSIIPTKITNNHFNLSKTEILNDENVNNKIGYHYQAGTIIPNETDNCEDITSIVKVEIFDTVARNELKNNDADDVVKPVERTPCENVPMVQENVSRQSVKGKLNFLNKLSKKDNSPNKTVVLEVTDKEVREESKTDLQMTTEFIVTPSLDTVDPIKESVSDTCIVNDKINIKELEQPFETNSENSAVTSEALPLNNFMTISESDNIVKPVSNKKSTVKVTSQLKPVEQREDQSNCKEKSPSTEEDENVDLSKKRKNPRQEMDQPKKTTRNKNKKTVGLTKSEKILDNQRSGSNFVGRGDSAPGNNSSQKNTRKSLSGATMFVPSLMLSFNEEEDADIFDTDSNEDEYSDMITSRDQEYEAHIECDRYHPDRPTGTSDAPDEPIASKISDGYQKNVATSNDLASANQMRSKVNSRNGMEKPLDKKAPSNIANDLQKSFIAAPLVVSPEKSAEFKNLNEKLANLTTQKKSKTNTKNITEKSKPKSFNKTVNFNVSPVDAAEQNEVSHANLKNTAALMETTLKTKSTMEKPLGKSSNSGPSSNESQESPIPASFETDPVVETTENKAEFKISEETAADFQKKSKRNTRSSVEEPLGQSSNSALSSNKSQKSPILASSETDPAVVTTESTAEFEISIETSTNITIQKKSKRNIRSSVEEPIVQSSNMKISSNELQKSPIPASSETDPVVVTTESTTELKIPEETSTNITIQKKSKRNIRSSVEKPVVKSSNTRLSSNKSQKSPISTSAETGPSGLKLKNSAELKISDETPANINIQKKSKRNTRSSAEEPLGQSSNSRLSSNKSPKSPTTENIAGFEISEETTAGFQKNSKRNTRSSVEKPLGQSSSTRPSNIENEKRKYPNLTRSETVPVEVTVETSSELGILEELGEFSRTAPHETKLSKKRGNAKLAKNAPISTKASAIGVGESPKEVEGEQTSSHERENRTNLNQLKANPRMITRKSNVKSTNAAQIPFQSEVIDVRPLETSNGNTGNAIEQKETLVDTSAAVEKDNARSSIDVVISRVPSTSETVENSKEAMSNETSNRLSEKQISTKKPKFNIKNAIDKSKPKSAYKAVTPVESTTVESVERESTSNDNPHNATSPNKIIFNPQSDMEKLDVSSCNLAITPNTSSTPEALNEVEQEGRSETSNEIPNSPPVRLHNEAVISKKSSRNAGLGTEPGTSNGQEIKEQELKSSDERTRPDLSSPIELRDEFERASEKDHLAEITESPITPKFKVNLRNAVGKASNVKTQNELVTSKKSQIAATNDGAPSNVSAEETQLKRPSTPPQDDDNQSTMSSSSTARQRREKGFVLKRHTTIVSEHGQDTTKMSLKELLNVAAMMPPPTNRKSTKKPSAMSVADSVSVAERENASMDTKPGVSNCKKLRLDMDGRIVIDELDNKTVLFNREGMDEIVVGADELTTTYRSYSKRKLSGKRWSPEETKNFYSALMALGTNFSAMASVFKGRSRDELKKKFKVEEKRNASLIDQILLSQTTWNISALKFESHITAVDSKKKRKPKQDAVKRSWHSDSDSDGDSKDEVQVPKKRRRFEPSTSKLDCTAPGVPDYLSVILK